MHLVFMCVTPYITQAHVTLYFSVRAAMRYDDVLGLSCVQYTISLGTAVCSH